MDEFEINHRQFPQIWQLTAKGEPINIGQLMLRISANKKS